MRSANLSSYLLLLLIAAGPLAAQPGPARLRVSPSDQVIAPGAKLQYTATLEFFEGIGAPGGEQPVTGAVIWSSLDQNIATIGPHTGMATASSGTISGPQTTLIIATSGTFKVSVPLTVSNAALTSITVTPANPSPPLGRPVQFTATGNYSDSSHHDLTDAVTWASSAPTVADISALGLARTKSPGSALISASLGGVTGTTTLTVGKAIVSFIEISPADSRALLPATQQFTATGVLTDGSTQDLTSMAAWSSSNPAVATIGASTGLASAQAAGATTISAAFSGVTGSTQWTVVALTSIALSPSDPTIFFGARQQFSATGTYSDGTIQLLTTTASWSSGDPGVATITSGGLAQSVHEGTTTIQAAERGVTGATRLSVMPNVSISVSPASALVAGLASQQFTSVVSGASDLSVTWSVNGVKGGNSALGTIDPTGLYRGPAAVPTPALVRITATSVAQPSRSASASVTVSAPVYLPLAVGNTWSYDCGGGVAITDTVTQTANVNGHSTFAMQFQFPNAAAQTFLLNNDAQGNTTLYGYLVSGKVVAITPAAYISNDPTPQQSFNYPALGGGTVQRVFVVIENTNPTPLGTFVVASYNDNGTQRIWGYTRGNGIMEQDHNNFDCKITSFRLR